MNKNVVKPNFDLKFTLLSEINVQAYIGTPLGPSTEVVFFFFCRAKNFFASKHKYSTKT